MYEYEVRQMKVFKDSSTDEARAELDGELNNMAKDGYRLVQVVTMPNTDIFGLYERVTNPTKPIVSIPPAMRSVGIKRKQP